MATLSENTSNKWNQTNRAKLGQDIWELQSQFYLSRAASVVCNSKS